MSRSGGAEAVRAGAAVLAGSPRKVAAANDRAGLDTAGDVNDSCATGFACFVRERSAFTDVFLAAAADASALAEALVVVEAPGPPVEAPALELFEPMVPGAVALRDTDGLATAAIVRGGATAASGRPHTLRFLGTGAGAAASTGGAELVAWAPELNMRLDCVLCGHGLVRPCGIASSSSPLGVGVKEYMREREDY